MKITAGDICMRVAVTRLLVKADQDTEYMKKIGIEDTSRFRSESENEEDKDYVECSGNYCGGRHSA